MRRTVVLLLLVALTSAAPAGEEGRLLAISAGRVILGNGEELGPSSILIRGEWIEAVGPGVVAPPGALRVDATDAVVMPGMISAHAWLDLEGTLGETARASTPALRAAVAIDPQSKAFAKERASGVTALLLAPSDRNVVGGRPALVLTDETATMLSETVGTKLAVGAPALNTARFPATHWGALDLLRRQGEIPGPWFVHAKTTGDVQAALTLMRSFPAATVRIVHGDDAWKHAKEIGLAGAAVIWGPADVSSEPLFLAGPKRLDEAGVALAFATDSRAGSLRLTAVLAHRSGLSRKATIRALTSGAAELVGAADHIGTIAKGRRADLVILSGDPLDLSAGVRQVFVGGKLVHSAKEAATR